MEFSLSWPATALTLLCRVGPAAAGPSSSDLSVRNSDLTADNSSHSDSSDGLVNSSNYISESDTSSDLLAAKEPQLRPATEELRTILERKKQSILAAVGDRNFEFNYFSMCRYIKRLDERFFTMLRVVLMGCSKTCAPSFLSKRLRNKVLAMSPADFRQDFDEMYSFSENVPRMKTYRRKVEEYAAMEKGLVRQVEKEAAGSDDVLRALENSLSKHRRKLLRYGSKLKSLTRLHRSCEKIHHSIMNEFPLHKMLGASSVSTLYESYLADKKDLKEREAARGDGQRGPPAEAGGTLGSACEKQHDKCPICHDPLEPDEYVIECKKHRFHGGCLYKWSEEKPTCPVCIKELTPDQRRRLEKGRRVLALQEIRSVSKACDDPAFEERYMRDGRPIERGEEEEALLSTVCRRIRHKTLNLRDSPHFSEVFDNQEDYPELYIPRNMVDYFCSTRAGHHDPRSRGFARFRAAMIGRIKLYMNRSMEIKNLMRENANDALFYSLLDVFCAGDCLVEHLYTRLYEIDAHVKKRSEIRSNAGAYPAIYSTMRQGRRLHPRSLRNTYDKFKSVIEDDVTRFLYYEWLEGF